MGQRDWSVPAARESPQGAVWGAEPRGQQELGTPELLHVWGWHRVPWHRDQGHSVGCSVGCCAAPGALLSLHCPVYRPQSHLGAGSDPSNRGTAALGAAGWGPALGKSHILWGTFCAGSVSQLLCLGKKSAPSIYNPVRTIPWSEVQGPCFSHLGHSDFLGVLHWDPQNLHPSPELLHPLAGIQGTNVNFLF